MSETHVVPRLDEKAITNLRHQLRDRLSAAVIPVPMGHAAEAIAAALGSASHAALLARIGESGAYDATFDQEALCRRLGELTSRPPGEVGSVVSRFIAWSLMTGALEATGLRRGQHGAETPPIDHASRGRMISPSKSAYLRRFPGNLIAFNAHLCTASAGRVWWGDLDLTRDEPELRRVANALGEVLYVLRESALGPDPERPDLSRAIAILKPGGST